MAFKDFKPTLYCTVLDVLMQSSDMISDQINLKIFDSSTDSIVRFAHQVEHDILDATNMVRSCLLNVYSESGLETTPHTGIPFRDVSNTSLSDGTSALLTAGQAGASAITEWWTLTFSSATNYAAKGSASESKGSSNITSDFTSTGDGDLILLADANPNIWTGTFANGQKFYIPTYKHKPIVVSVTAMLALAYALDHVFQAEIPNASEYGTTMEERAMKWLNQLSDPYESGVVLDGLPPERDLSDIQIPYIELFDVTGAGPQESDLAADDYASYMD